ncbi:hypothetical protein GJV03_08010 [Acinetobacter sp. RIT698]|uniref:hypothetical protein n=1 Tax=Acinetobacter sp. RIT698 TaxID=2666192 RepID=UPI0012ACE2AE|nr:hypothetical protein [Acinetobacter sp. RIT698]MRT37103.1 hypothetical protein [Acinetobacter sp. RIT698]
MDINKERESFEKLQNPKFFKRAVYLDNSNAYVVNDDYRDDLFSLEWVLEINYGWLMWQAAKAIPEGFVLMPMVPSERMVVAVRHCYEGESYLPYSLYSEFVNQAMIEAQEQSHD